jgi:hypothetical protein
MVTRRLSNLEKYCCLKLVVAMRSAIPDVPFSRRSAFTSRPPIRDDENDLPAGKSR